MTTSTIVYMFALAVADLTVCICGILLTTLKLQDHSLRPSCVGHFLSLPSGVCIVRAPAGGAASTYGQSEFAQDEPGAGDYRCCGRSICNGGDIRAS